jgi:hypothetical protein
VNASAIGAGARAIRENQMMLGASSTEVTAASLSGSGTELIVANEDGTLKRAVGIGASDGSLTVANASVTNDLSVGGDTSLTTVTASGATN